MSSRRIRHPIRVSRWRLRSHQPLSDDALGSYTIISKTPLHHWTYALLPDRTAYADAQLTGSWLHVPASARAAASVLEQRQELRKGRLHSQQDVSSVDYQRYVLCYAVGCRHRSYTDAFLHRLQPGSGRDEVSACDVKRSASAELQLHGTQLSWDRAVLLEHLCQQWALDDCTSSWRPFL